MKTSTQQRTVPLAWDMAELLELKTGPQDILVVDRKSIPRTAEAIQQSPVTDFRTRIARTTAASKVAAALRQLRLVDAELQEDIEQIALTIARRPSPTVVADSAWSWTASYSLQPLQGWAKTVSHSKTSDITLTTPANTANSDTEKIW
jgi:hypothetical protein